MNKPKFWTGILLVFLGGFRFFATMVGLIAWDYVVLVLFEGTLFWWNQWLFLGVGWGEAYVVTWLGVKLIKESFKGGEKHG